MRYAHLGPLVLREAINILADEPTSKNCHNNVTNDNFQENYVTKFLTQKINFIPVNTKETSI
jgi:hypothetical protein